MAAETAAAAALNFMVSAMRTAQVGFGENRDVSRHRKKTRRDANWANPGAQGVAVSKSEVEESGER